MDTKDSLVDRIEEVKTKIADFEKDLNINFIDINRVTRDQNKNLINQINDYKDKIDSIEKEVSKEKVQVPLEQEPLLPANKTLNVATTESNVPKNHLDDLKENMNKVEQEKQEIDNINNLLEKLKKNVAEQKKSNISAAPAKTKIESKINENTIQPIQKNNLDKPVKILNTKAGPIPHSDNKPNNVVDKSQENIKITDNDLRSISELISKLDELLRSNKNIADKLDELLKEQKQTYSETSKSSELIKKLAILGSSENLSQL